LRFLQHNDIKLPIRPHAGPNKGELEWRTATPSVVNNVLTHELYAGMYRFGHNQTDPRRKVPGHPDSGRVDVPPEKYHALIPNHCPAYIAAEQYQRNQLWIEPGATLGVFNSLSVRRLTPHQEPGESSGCCGGPKLGRATSNRAQRVENPSWRAVFLEGQRFPWSTYSGWPGRRT
jgi:recombinase